MASHDAIVPMNGGLPDTPEVFAMTAALMTSAVMIGGGLGIVTQFYFWPTWVPDGLQPFFVVFLGIIAAFASARFASGQRSISVAVAGLMSGIVGSGIALAAWLLAGRLLPGSLFEFQWYAGSPAMILILYSVSTTVLVMGLHRIPSHRLWIGLVTAVLAVGLLSLAYGHDIEHRSLDGIERDVFGLILPWGPNGISAMLLHQQVAPAFGLASAAAVAVLTKRRRRV
jgi:hypothetical protein